MDYHRPDAVADASPAMSPFHDPPTDNGQIEALLARLQQGDKTAMDQLLALLFDDLRRLARSQRRRVGGGETLRTTALVHEAYLKMRRNTALAPESRRHFLHTAALAMRQILIDHARSQLAARDRRALVHQEAQDRQAEIERQARLMLDIDAALTRLGSIDPRLAEVVNYRYFAGYKEAEIAELLEVSERTVRRDWFKAKAWLAEALDPATASPP